MSLSCKWILSAEDRNYSTSSFWKVIMVLLPRLSRAEELYFKKKKKMLVFPLFKTNKKPRRNTKCSLTAFSAPQRPTAYIIQTDRFPPPILQISTPSPSELILWDLDPSQVRLTWSIFNGCHWLFHPVSQQLLQFKTAATLLPLWRNTGLRIYRNYSSAS